MAHLNLEYRQNRNITEDTRKEIEMVFHECDQNFKGYLTREDLKVAVVSLLGYKPSKFEVDDMTSSLPPNASGMSLDVFVPLMSAKLSAIDEDEHIRQIFLSMDTRCQGFLTMKDLEQAVGHIAPNLPHHALHSAFKEIDRDGDGRVSYKDFEFMMKYATEEKL